MVAVGAWGLWEHGGCGSMGAVAKKLTILEHDCFV